MNLEVCVDNLESVQVCADEGVDRIELCACLADGGLTPSLAFIRAARRIFPGKIMAMLRPHGGHFCYSCPDIGMMIEEAEIMMATGVDGIVFGVLRPDGQVASKECARIIARVGYMETVFHRAIDVSRDPLESLDVLVDLGITRVLTSGGAADVQRGADMLRKMVARADGGIDILAGGGLKLDGVPELIRNMGLEGIHLSARQAYEGPMVFRHAELDFSSPGGNDHVRMVASAEMIRAVKEAVKAGTVSPSRPPCAPATPS